MEQTKNKLMVDIVAATCPITKYISVDVPCEVGGPLREWTENTPNLEKILSTETKVHMIEKEGKPLLIFTITIVYEIH